MAHNKNCKYNALMRSMSLQKHNIIITKGDGRMNANVFVFQIIEMALTKIVGTMH